MNFFLLLLVFGFLLLILIKWDYNNACLLLFYTWTISFSWDFFSPQTNNQDKPRATHEKKTARTPKKWASTTSRYTEVCVKIVKLFIDTNAQQEEQVNITHHSILYFCRFLFSCCSLCDFFCVCTTSHIVVSYHAKQWTMRLDVGQYFSSLENVLFPLSSIPKRNSVHFYCS